MPNPKWSRLARRILAAFCLASTASLASAQEVATAESLLGTCSFASKYNQTWCKTEQTRFLDLYRKSLEKDYHSQRSVAACLFNGCDGAVTVDKSQACAWRLLILESGYAFIDVTDESNFRSDCRGQETDEAREKVRAIAQALMMRIYAKPLSSAH